MEDGRITQRVEADGPLVALRLTTRGPGRLRILVDGQPAERLWMSDGWWSSWTDAPVTTELELSPAGVPQSRLDLTVEVEGYAEGLTIEVMPQE